MKIDNFMNWIVDNVPYYDKLTQEEQKELSYLYKDVETWDKVWSNTLKLGMRPSAAGIDYSNDFEKAGANSIRATKNLNNYLESLAIKYGYKNKEENKTVSNGK